MKIGLLIGPIAKRSIHSGVAQFGSEIHFLGVS